MVQSNRTSVRFANAKRLKTNDDDDDDDVKDDDDDDDRKQPAMPVSSLLRNSNTSTIAKFPIIDDHLLRLIFSYVGKYQYRFVGRVNRHFHKLYLSFDPSKKTHIIATTIELTKLVLDDIEANTKLCVLPRTDFDERSEVKSKDDERCELWKTAARYGNMDVIKYLHEVLSSRKNKDDGYERWKHRMCYKAAMYDHLELLQWAIDNGVAVKTDDTVCQFALANGHMKLFHWLEKAGFVFYHDEDAAYMAARNGQLEVLKYLDANGYYLDGDGRYEGSGCCNWAAQYGHLEVVKFLHSIHCNWDASAVDVALDPGKMEILEYLLSNDCPTSDNSCVIAASCGNLEALKLLRSYDCEWDQLVPATAAACGHVDIIEWACKNGCPSSELSCQYAAGYGQLETLKWLRTNNFPWDTTITENASTDEIYKWAVDNGCPVREGNPRTKLRSGVFWIKGSEDEEE